jgi:hypothetical protein
MNQALLFKLAQPVGISGGGLKECLYNVSIPSGELIRGSIVKENIAISPCEGRKSCLLPTYYRSRPNEVLQCIAELREFGCMLFEMGNPFSGCKLYNTPSNGGACPSG